MGQIAGRAGYRFPVAAHKLPYGGIASPPLNAVFVAVSVGEDKTFSGPSDRRGIGGRIRFKAHGGVGYSQCVYNRLAAAAGKRYAVGSIAGNRPSEENEFVGIQGDIALG